MLPDNAAEIIKQQPIVAEPIVTDEQVEEINPAPRTAEPAKPPTVEEVLAVIKRLSAKQADIEVKKTELKQSLINEIWML